MKNKDKEYSQGVAGDSPVILCDGLPMTPDMIVDVLNSFTNKIEQLETLLERWLAEEPHSTELSYDTEEVLENK